MQLARWKEFLVSPRRRKTRSLSRLTQNSGECHVSIARKTFFYRAVGDEKKKKKKKKKMCHREITILGLNYTATRVYAEFINIFSLNSRGKRVKRCVL